MTVSTAREANGHTGGMTSEEQDPQVPARARRRSYTAKYKLEILAEYEQCDREGKGALLRRESLYTSLLSEWRRQRDRGALEGLSARKSRWA
jgi:transposase